MSEVENSSGELKNTGYELFIAALTILSMFNIVLLYAFRDDDNLQDVLFVMDTLLTTVFFIDFIYRLFTARSKSEYFLRQFGWADLLACLPFKQFKVFRIFRLVRVIRLMRASGLRRTGRRLLRDRAGSALLTLLLLGILVLEFGSLQILRLEQHAEGANILSASDALWYVIVTISTVGYGDRFPVTDIGRFMGALIIIIGVAIFGTFTGYLANLFLTPRASDKTAD
jgi:voltage-gated potassium channel